jgi:hypothetical protein
MLWKASAARPNHTPLGFNALQLSTDRDPDAIHGEPLAPEMLMLATLVDERLLAPAPTDLVTHPPRIPPRARPRAPCSATSPPTVAAATMAAVRLLPTCLRSPMET